MCRLILMNKNGEKEIEKNYGLENYLKYLEQECGGHGNGYALMRKGKVIALEKGMKLDVKSIAKTIRKANYDWCIFHTRLASVSGKSDSNCHPFRRGTEVMAMNGTERSVGLVSSVKEITDTEAILDLKSLYKWELPALRWLDSIFVGFSKGKPYVVANNTYNLKLLNNKKNNAVVFASSFPDKIKKNIYAPKEEFIWYDEPINMKLFNKYKKAKKVYPTNWVYPTEDVMDEEKHYRDHYDEYYEDLYELYYRQQNIEKEGEENVA